MTQKTFTDTLLDDQNNFTAVRQFFDENAFRQLVLKADSADTLAGLIGQQSEILGCPDFVSELGAMEGHLFKLSNQEIPFDPHPAQRTINPGLKLFSNSWKHLLDYLDGSGQKRSPEKGVEQVMIWPVPGSDRPAARLVTDEDLLVLKIILENLSPEKVAELSGTFSAAINGALLQALEVGIILGPRTKIFRIENPAENHTADQNQRIPEAFMSSRVFALQWHITQACDLSCRHCYDRSPSEPLGLSREIDILDSLDEFCTTHQVFGQVSFTGGNPLLHPNFHRLYKEASDRGFFIGILGNPASQAEIDSLMAVQPPSFFQMSLEGLETHNDYMRGPGHFQKVAAFLDVLKENDIYSKIMLTLTRENLDQVIDLGKFLQNRTDLFTFNRLSLVGEGANLIMADPADFRNFLGEYFEASRDYPVFDLKDNLFNILLEEKHAPLFGGCTGYGCGAAFNFVSVLATGEVHGCRKFPSPIGDLTRQSLTDIYHSDLARRYRQGAEACQSCKLNPVCRGCLAATYSHGLDVFVDKDPYCFNEHQ